MMPLESDEWNASSEEVISPKSSALLGDDGECLSLDSLSRSSNSVNSVSIVVGSLMTGMFCWSLLLTACRRQVYLVQVPFKEFNLLERRR
jgi:hypothetical protein